MQLLYDLSKTIYLLYLQAKREVTGSTYIQPTISPNSFNNQR